MDRTLGIDVFRPLRIVPTRALQVFESGLSQLSGVQLLLGDLTQLELLVALVELVIVLVDENHVELDMIPDAIDASVFVPFIDLVEVVVLLPGFILDDLAADQAGLRVDVEAPEAASTAADHPAVRAGVPEPVDAFVDVFFDVRIDVSEDMRVSELTLVQHLTDFGVDFIPRPTNLLVEVTVEGPKHVRELFGVITPNAVSGIALLLVDVVVAILALPLDRHASFGIPGARPAPRLLGDDLAHVLTHSASPQVSRPRSLQGF